MSSAQTELTYWILQASTPTSKARIRVRITPPHDNRTVAVANTLTEELRSKVPFDYEIEPYGEPEIVILGGTRKARMMAVQMVINHKLADDVATKLLKEHPFYNFEEPILG